MTWIYVTLLDVSAHINKRHDYVINLWNKNRAAVTPPPLKGLDKDLQDNKIPTADFCINCNQTQTWRNNRWKHIVMTNRHIGLIHAELYIQPLAKHSVATKRSLTCRCIKRQTYKSITTFVNVNYHAKGHYTRGIILSTTRTTLPTHKSHRTKST